MSALEEYRGWSIDFDLKPIPHRGFDWTATSPDYDVDYDEDGPRICSGQQVSAATFEDLCVEIDCAIMDEVEA